MLKADNLPPSCAVVMKSGTLTSWNPLDHYRPVTGLPLVYVVKDKSVPIEALGVQRVPGS